MEGMLCPGRGGVHVGGGPGPCRPDGMLCPCRRPMAPGAGREVIVKVSEVIAGQELITARLATPLGEVADLMSRHRVTGIPIVDEWGALCGLVTAATLAQLTRGTGSLPQDQSWGPAQPAAEPHFPWRELEASDVMTTDLVTVMHDAGLRDAARAMSNRGVHRAVVLGKDRNVMGVLSALDFVLLVAEGKLGA